MDSPEDEMGSPFVAFSSPCADDSDASGEEDVLVAALILTVFEAELELEPEELGKKTKTLG